MKIALKQLNLKMLFTLMVCTLVQVVLFAQDSGGSSTTSSSKKVDINVESSNGDWYTSPWVWIIGAAVFILLLVALVGGGRGRASNSITDRVTVTKTVERDTDV
jgi:hypothetical protein